MGIANKVTAKATELFSNLLARPPATDEAALERLADAAQQALVAAQQATQAARDRWDLTVADDDLELYRAAQSNEQAAALHVERVGRLVAKAEQERAHLHRAELVRRRAELQADLEASRVAKERAPLEAEHVEVLVRAVELYELRRQQQEVINDRRIALHRLEDEIRQHDEAEQARSEGREPPEFESRPAPYSFSEPNMDKVIAALHSALDRSPNQFVRAHADALIDVLKGRVNRQVIVVPQRAALEAG